MPVHTRRRWAVKEIAMPGHLAYLLIRHSHTLCTGFRHGGYLFLNDDFTEDSAGEWSIVREDTMEQIETITFGWMKHEARAMAFIARIVKGEFDDTSWKEWVGKDLVAPDRIEDWREHRSCRLCA